MSYQREVWCLRIVATDGTAIRLIQYPHDVEMSGETYVSDFGYEFTGIQYETSSSAAILDLKGVLDAAGVDLEGLATQKWDNAKCYLFTTDWSNPTEDENPKGLFLFGKTEISETGYSVELMQLIDAINQPIGRIETALCPWVLFDETLDGKTLPYSASRCGLDITTYTVTGTITAVTDRYTFTDTARTEVDDYFAKGEIRFTTGNNANLPAFKVKSYASDQFVLHDAAFFDVQVGDAYEAVPGCRKRRVDDCFTKFSNAVNFGGADMLPPPGTINKVGGLN